MNTQLHRIKCYLSCFFFSFLAQNCSGFTTENVVKCIVMPLLRLRYIYWLIYFNICYKKCFLIFVLFLILSLCHDDVSLGNDRNLSKDTIHFSISFWWLVPPLLFFKIVFHSVQLRIPLISSLRNIYLRHAVFNF